MRTSLALRLIASAGIASALCAQESARQASPLSTHAQQYLQARVFELGLDTAHDFTARSVNHDELGQDHIRVDQYYRGIKVFGGEAIVHMQEGAVSKVTDALVRGIKLNPTPAIDASEALAAADQYLAPAGAYASRPTAELVFARVEREVSTPRVGLSRDFEGSRTVTRTALVYHIHTELENGTQETRHTDFFVDAHTGEILESWDTLHTSAASGTGNSQFSGTANINTNSLASGFEMRDVVRSMHYDTRDLNHATSGNGTTYTDPDNTWGDGANYAGGATTSNNGQTAAVDAHYGVGLTADYYLNIHSRNGIDGIGTATYSRVHYSSAYDNAFWSDSCFCMTYGDGSSFKSLESIDVAGHEMSHGVCARTANLTYRGESGGLNEANSDINGTMVEFMAHGSGTTSVPNTASGNMAVYWTGTTTSTPSTTKSVPSANYLIGEQLATSKFTHPLRFMYKPSLDGSSPNSWSTSLKRLDVHYSSGVANHFFFLLAHGTAADAYSDGIASPTSNGSTIVGIGNDKAIRIWYRALTAYMTSSTNYAGARVACINAASDLVTSGKITSADAAVVAAAWSAVNVN